VLLMLDNILDLMGAGDSLELLARPWHQSTARPGPGN
jgi:hypothetical protein